jgi:hypothetical protein
MAWCAVFQSISCLNWLKVRGTRKHHEPGHAIYSYRCKQWRPDIADFKKEMKKGSIVFALVMWTVGLNYGQTGPIKITTDHIRIDHRGPSDKPIFPLIIATTNLELDILEIEIVVDKNLFSLVRDFLKANTLIEDKREVNEFGVFQVRIQDNKQLQSSYFPSRLKSISILKSLKEEVRGRSTSEKLIVEIDRVLKRIEF